ncbi:MAG: LysM peptidoglycan-binding domain-containing protein [Anaerolineae bacterium]|nr:LysM peptidoglycan-binding domain-containing protein [Anaerolineae bacterium]MCA9911077.1 LysM peptidoglycan-binding domain-containing protein [Anaerolineae bacterium]
MSVPQLAHIIIDTKDIAVVGDKWRDQTVPVMFNPTEYSLTKGAQIAEIAIPGLDSPILQFVRGQNARLTVDLFFDTTDSGMDNNARDVRDETTPFFELVRIQPKTHAPPRIEFVWGSLRFKAIVESINQKFTLFAPNGNPLRATLTMTMREYKTLQNQIEELNLQSSDHTKRRTVKRGETLSQIAYEEYKSVDMWRLIAVANNLSNPRDLTPGMDLMLPPSDPTGSRSNPQ